MKQVERKQARRTASERPLPREEDQAPTAPPAPWPGVEPEPAVWETGFMASRQASRIPALYRPRKMVSHMPEPTW